MRLTTPPNTFWRNLISFSATARIVHSVALNPQSGTGAIDWDACPWMAEYKKKKEASEKRSAE